MVELELIKHLPPAPLLGAAKEALKPQEAWAGFIIKRIKLFAGQKVGDLFQGTDSRSQTVIRKS